MPFRGGLDPLPSGTISQYRAKSIYQDYVDKGVGGAYTPVEVKEKGMANYTIRGVRTFQGMEGDGLNATLYRDGKKVAFILDEGCGGCMDFQWEDGHHNSKVEEALFKNFIAELKVTKSTEKDQYGFSERDLFDGDIWVWDTINKAADDRRMKRLCKTHAVYQVEGDPKAYPGGPEILTLKRDMAGAREYVAKRYPGKKVVFLNEEVNTFPPVAKKPNWMNVPIKPPVNVNGALVTEIPCDPTFTGEELENGVDCFNCNGTGKSTAVFVGQKREEWCLVCKGAGRIPKRKAQHQCYYAQFPDELAKMRAPLEDPLIGKGYYAPPAKCEGPVLWWKKNWFNEDAQKRGAPKHLFLCKAHAEYERPVAGKTKVTEITNS